MIEKTLVVTNKLGIHARPAGMIVDITGQAKSDISIVFEGSKANAKSILNVMMLAIPAGSEVTFEIDGEDAEQVASQLESLFNDHFNEEPYYEKAGTDPYCSKGRSCIPGLCHGVRFSGYEPEDFGGRGDSPRE